MKKQTWVSSVTIRLIELWDEPLTKVALGFGVGLLILLGAFAVGYIPDPMRNHGLGPGWECDANSPAAVTCARDVPSWWGEKKSN
jgi:hypothetical protein